MTGQERPSVTMSGSRAIRGALRKSAASQAVSPVSRAMTTAPPCERGASPAAAPAASPTSPGNPPPAARRPSVRPSRYRTASWVSARSRGAGTNPGALADGVERRRHGEPPALPPGLLMRPRARRRLRQLGPPGWFDDLQGRVPVFTPDYKTGGAGSRVNSASRQVVAPRWLPWRPAAARAACSS